MIYAIFSLTALKYLPQKKKLLKCLFDIFIASLRSSADEGNEKKDTFHGPLLKVTTRLIIIVFGASKKKKEKKMLS